MTQQNPLSAYFRSMELATNLPSRGLFYSDDVVDMEPDGELDVFAMTAKDELLMKNPDALLNGTAVTALIKSCVPAVKKPEALLQTDVDALLVAIYGASNGNIDISAKCPKCKAQCDGTIPATDILGTMKVLEKVYEFTYDEGLVFTIQPCSYQTAIDAGITQFRSTQSLKALGEIENDEERLHALSESIANVAELEFRMIVDSVASIKLPDGQIVTDKAFIVEFFENAKKGVVQRIRDNIQDVNSLGINKEMTMMCEACSLTDEQIAEKIENGDAVEGELQPEQFLFETVIELNPINFFIAS